MLLASRKPQPGMAVAFIEKYGLKPSACIMVGDLGTDKTFAERLGLRFVPAAEFFRTSLIGGLCLTLHDRRIR